MIEHIKEQRKKSIWLWIGIGSILIVGLFFRFYNIDKKVYWVDEVNTSLRISGYTWTEVRNSLSDRVVSIEDLKRFQYPNPDRGLYFTIKSLSIEDPQHPPLYYGLVRIWVETFGDSVWSVRSLSAFASILVFPFFFWLCRELFESKWVAWTAVVLLAVSPVNVLLAQEARQYSLWTLTILLSSATLLRALSFKRIYLWILYAVTVVLGIFTHTLFVLVIAAHGVYLFGTYLKQINFKPFKLPRELIFYIMATLAGLVVFTPWAYFIFANLSTVKAKLYWLSPDPGLIYLIGQWGFNYSSVFFDAGHAFKYVQEFDFDVLLSYSIRVMMLFLMAYSIYFLYSNTTNRVRLFILSLILIPFLLLSVPDLVLGGTRSGNGYKYLIPSFLGIEISVAYLFTKKIFMLSLKRRTFWQVVTPLLIALGIISCAISSQAKIWWTKEDYHIAELSREINQGEKPLLITELNLNSGARLIAFSHLLKPNVHFLGIGTPVIIQIPEGFSDFFVYEPSPMLQKKLFEIDGHTLERVDTKGLWQIIKKD